MEKRNSLQIKKPKENIHGNRIREILDERKMSHIELADLALSGNASHLSRIINGQRRCISLPIAMRIAKALGMQVEDIFILDSSDEQN